MFPGPGSSGQGAAVKAVQAGGGLGTGDKPDRRLHDLGRESGRESGLRFLSQGGDKDRRKIVFFLKVGFYKRGRDIVLKIKGFNGLVVTLAAGF